MKDLKTNLDWALYYRSIGWSVFPIPKGSKIPIVSWKKYQTEVATENEIRAWWTINPDSNIALATGKVSDLIIFDLDAKHGRTSKEFQIPPTVCARSGGGGEHFFFKYPESHVQSSNGQLFGPGVDVKGDGGYVVLSPSLHESGNQYEWIIEPGENEIVNIPEWLVQALNTQNSKNKLWQNGIQGVSEGQRNEVAASVAGKILQNTNKDLWENLGWEQFVLWNKRNLPPLQEKELRGVWESIQKRELSSEIKPKENLYKNKSEAVFVRLSDIKSEQISWLWPQRFALGKLSLIAGDPGIGKSLLTATLASYVSLGGSWPVDNTPIPKGDVILLSAEDDPADTIKPRLEAAGADCTRIHVLRAIKEKNSNGEIKERIFSFQKDVKALEEMLNNLPDCKMVIIDPVSAYLDGTDSHNNAEVRGVLAPLAEMAMRHKAAIILVHHLNKNSSGGNAIYRTMGSLAFTAAVRAAFIVALDKDNNSRRLFLSTKNNLAKLPLGLAYTVRGGQDNPPYIVWETEYVDLSANDALDNSESLDDRTNTDWAVDVLLDILANGPVPAVEANKLAKQAGVTDKPLRNARKRLKIKPYKVDFRGPWMWKLPTNEDAQSIEDDPHESEGVLDV